MKTEKHLQTVLTEAFSPDDGQIAAMEQNIMNAVQSRNTEHPQSSLRFRVPAKAILAAAMVLILSVTGISAASSIRKFFFPGAGVVEMESTDEPLYMILDTEAETGADYEILFGYWYNGKATVHIQSITHYENLDPTSLFDAEYASLTLEEIHFTYDSNTAENIVSGQEYRIVLDSLPYTEIQKGIRFGNTVLHFDSMPVDYHPYIKEENGLRLTLVPMTLDYTMFAAEVAYTNKEGALTLQTKSHYLPNKNESTMYLIDADGKMYPLQQDKNSIFYRIDESPSAPIVGFRAEQLIFSRDFTINNQEPIITLSLPAQGEAVVINQQFTFPDGIVGNIHAVGYDNAILEEQYIDKESEFPLGYLSVITEAVEQNGIRYWFELFYTDEYTAYLNQFTVEEVRDPYSVSPMAPLSPKFRISLIGLENMVHHTEHYVPNGQNTIDMKADSYTGIASGEWNIDFNRTAE